MLCPNEQLKFKQGTECELKFCHYFDILTDVYDILFQNRLKVTPLMSFVGSMSQREGVMSSTSTFQQHQTLGSKVGHDWAIDLLC